MARRRLQLVVRDDNETRRTADGKTHGPVRDVWDSITKMTLLKYVTIFKRTWIRS